MNTFAQNSCLGGTCSGTFPQRMVEFSGHVIAQRMREARMSFFNAPFIKDLGQEQKESLIDAAYQRTILNPEARIDLPGAEIMIGFVFKKV